MEDDPFDHEEDRSRPGSAPTDQSVKNIAIANSNAAASAYTRSAIEEAILAVDELN